MTNPEEIYLQIADKLRSAKENFEAMDRGMRTPGVPISVAQDAFECGMRYLREAQEILAPTQHPTNP